MAAKSNHIISLPSIEQVQTELNRINHRSKFKKTMISTISILIVVAAVAVLISTLFLPVVQVSGNSMEPSLTDGDILVTVRSDKIGYGDICCVSWQNKLLLKRIIGMPGDIINIDSSGNVYVNNVLTDEPYINEKSPGVSDIDFPFLVPDNKYFILGDRRESSADSRNSAIGCIGKDQIVGRVLFKVWPLSDK